MPDGSKLDPFSGGRKQFLSHGLRLRGKSALLARQRRSFLSRPKMNREALDKFCERGILGLVLAILVFGPLAMGAVDAPAFLVVQGLTIGVMLLVGVADLGRPQAATALAADLLGRAGVRDLRRRALSHGGHRIRRAAGDDPGADVRVPVFCHRQQSLPAGNGANHRVHPDFSGDGHFRLRGLSIFHALEPRLEFHLALSRAAPRALTFRRTTWPAFWKCCCRWRRPMFWPGG